MRPITGWVSAIKGSEAEIRLKTGPTIITPVRDGLHWGESVRVFYNYDKMCPGQVLTLEELALMGAEDEDTWTEEDHPWDETDICNIIESL